MGSKILMKKIFIILVLFLSSSITNADDLNKNNRQENIKYCQQYENYKTDLKEDPGYYYYHVATCMYEKINDGKSFLEVSELFKKSASYNYPLSNFSLGFLYETKYKTGSIVFGVPANPEDLIIAIENYTKAANAGSASAQNNLGELYLDEANLSEKLKGNDNRNDVKNDNVPIQLPDLSKALYWLELAAQNGDPAAQGTVADLYRQGVGVTQDFVISYSWFNLSFASQMTFNKSMYEKIGKEMVPVMMKERDDVYNSLTDIQKNKAQELSKNYKEKYFHFPSTLDKACKAVQKYMALKNSMKLISHTVDAYKKFQTSLTNKLIDLCGATYHIDKNNHLIVVVDQRKTIKLLSEAIKMPDVIYSSKISLKELKDHPMEITLVASLKAAVFLVPYIFENNPKLNTTKVKVYLIHNVMSEESEKDLFFSYDISKNQNENIDWEKFNAFDSIKIFDNFRFGNSSWIANEISKIGK